MAERQPFRSALRELSNASLASGIGLFTVAMIGGLFWIVIPFVVQIAFFQLLTKRVARQISGGSLPPVPRLPLSVLYLLAGALMVVLSYFLLLFTIGLLLGAIVLGLGMAQAICATWFAPRAVALVSGLDWVSGAGFLRRLGVCIAVLAPVAVLFAATSYGLYFASGAGRNDYTGLLVFLMVPSFFIVFYLAPVAAFAATIVHCRYEKGPVVTDATSQNET